MKIQIPTFFRTKYNLLRTRISTYYHRALQFAGCPDGDPARVMAAVVVVVGLWYVGVALSAIIDLLNQATHSLTALVTQ